MEQLRQRIVSGLRAARLLNAVDRTLYVMDLLRHFRDNRAIREEYPELPFPPYPLMFDAFGNCSRRGYHDGGVAAARFIATTIRRFMPGDLTVCEWGCGPARTLQHIRTVDAGFTRVIGTDYNPDTIAWCRRVFPQMEFAVNGMSPPLPLPDSSVDVLYAISVFTHLSKQRQLEWIGEIGRVLKPKGMLFFTVHGERCVSKLLPVERARFDRGELVVRAGVREGKKHFVTYESERFVREGLLTSFAHIEPIDWPNLGQDAWVARAPVQNTCASEVHAQQS
jgi:SAM-dependent methyltransferase